MDDLVAPCKRCGDVNRWRRRLGRSWDATRLCERLSGTQQRLRRHACVEGALAADELALDDRDVGAGIGKAAGDDLSSGTGADHDHIEAPHQRSQACVESDRIV